MNDFYENSIVYLILNKDKSKKQGKGLRMSRRRAEGSPSVTERLATRVNSAMQTVNNTVGEFGRGVVESARQTGESLRRGWDERHERRDMKDQLFSSDVDGMATMGEQVEMTADLQDAADSFLAARNQAWADAWAYEHGEDSEMDMFIPELYVVRGANLRCTEGSHIRKLNLPKDHGIYITREPLIHKEDCLVGDDQNITTFGVCESRGIYNLSPRPPTVILKKCKYNNYTGDEMESEEDLGNVRGPACTPQIAGTWLNTFNDTRIVDNGDKDPEDKYKSDDDPTKGYPAVTTKSFLVCACGGFIEPVSCGQHLDARIAAMEAAAWEAMSEEERAEALAMMEANSNSE